MCLTGVVRRTPVPRHAKEARDGASIQSEKTAGPDPTGRNVPPAPPLPATTGRYARFPGLGPKRVRFVVSRVSQAIRKRRNSNDLGFACRRGLRAGRPRPGDMPVFLGLWLKGGMCRLVSSSSLDTRVAEFQRFAISESEWFASVPAPTWEMRLFLAVGAGDAVRRASNLLHNA